MVPPLRIRLLILTLAVLRLHGARSYTWSFQETPTQCGEVTASITGSDGTPPYRILVIPNFGSTSTGQNKVYMALDLPFPDNQRQIKFQLPYPAGLQFVAVVSDTIAFGSGGTSVSTNVTASNDASCFDPNSSVTFPFYFETYPTGQAIIQCQEMRIAWSPSLAQGVPNFLGVIPGGQSFAIPQGANTTIPSEDTGFNWTPSLRGGTTLILIGGDVRGNGTAGWTQNVVSFGTNDDTSCLSNNSPSSTPGSPAGGYPTSPAAESTHSSAGGSKQGAIIGGVVGGIAALIVAVALILCFRRRRNRAQAQRDERPAIDLAEIDSMPFDPYYHQPKPAKLSNPTLRSGSPTGMEDTHLLGQYSPMLSATPDEWGYGVEASESGSSTARKGRQVHLRNVNDVNYIQHEDAGPSSPPPQQEPKTVELPPAYTALRQDESAAGTSASQPKTLDKRKLERKKG